MEVLTDTFNGVVFSKRAMNDRYQQFDSGVQSMIQTQGVAALVSSSFLAYPNVAQLVLTHEKIRERLPQITSDIVKLALVRKIGSVVSFMLVYETENAAYRVEAINLGSGILIVGFE